MAVVYDLFFIQNLKGNLTLYRVPDIMRLIYTSLKFTLFHMIIFTLFRVSFYSTFSGLAISSKSHEVLNSFRIGALFDLRLTLLLLLPLFVFVGVKKLTSLFNNLNKSVVIVYALFAAIWLTMYFLDFGQYSYLKTRLDTSVLQFFKNPLISAKMMFSTYPMHWIVLGFSIVLFIYAFLIKKTVFSNLTKGFASQSSQKLKFSISLLFIVFMLLGLYGKVSYYPLRWSEAFFSKNSFVNHLALNPILYFFDSSRFSEKKFNVEKTKEHFGAVSKYLGLVSSKPLNFERTIVGTSKKKYNVVFIIMESLASHKTNLMSNPLAPTPYLEKITQESYFFSQHYTPTLGTARGVFGSLTSIPDVSRVKTSSRNPFVIDQRLLIDQLKGYEKFYFLGGSANWANIRAVFSNNISGINIYEEGSYSRGDTDVWGLSDLDLFIESNKILNSQSAQKPFFAIIQSSSFHRPYTIPDDALDFKKMNKDISEGELKNNGFYSMDQLNSLRFSDYSLGHFFKLAKKSKYYKDTIFVITGDHGLPIENAQNVPRGSKEFDLEGRHVPLIFHNKELFPKYIEDQRVVGMVDIIPTIFSFLNGKFTNFTMGRNLFSESSKNSNYSFYFDNYSKLGQRKLFNKDYVIVNDDRDQPKLYKYSSSIDQKDISKNQKEIFKEMYSLLEGYYRSSQYLLYNNKKKQK